eukprot:scaffold439339_cov42-Prasinocladus_malaysianus.AAC.1
MYHSRTYLLEDIRVRNNDSQIDVYGRDQAALEFKLAELDCLEKGKPQWQIYHDKAVACGGQEIYMAAFGFRHPTSIS